MSDRFEHDLQRLFAEAPPRPDAELFALRVRERLDMTWTWRSLAVGCAGAGAGALALWQLGGAQVLARLGEAVQAPVGDAWRRAPVLADVAQALQAAPVPPELVWLLGGLTLLAAGFAATRAFDGP